MQASDDPFNAVQISYLQTDEWEYFNIPCDFLHDKYLRSCNAAINKEMTNTEKSD